MVGWPSPPSYVTEALHREPHSWFDDIHGMYQATLILNLRIMLIAKLLPHVSALFHQTAKSYDQHTLLSRLVVSMTTWSDDDWTAWYAATSSGTRVVKSALPLNEERMQHAEAVKKHKATTPTKAKAKVVQY